MSKNGNDFATEFDKEFGTNSSNIFTFLAEGWKSGRVPARIKAAALAEVSILGGGLEIMAGLETGGGVATPLFALGYGNISDGATSYMNIFSSGHKDFNGYRIALQSLYGDKTGEHIFLGIDFAIGVGGMASFSENTLRFYSSSTAAVARDTFILGITADGTVE